jgi:hypothetical protein
VSNAHSKVCNARFQALYFPDLPKNLTLS